MHQFVGSHSWLAGISRPVLFLLLWNLAIVVLWPGRKLFQGKAYNVAFSSNYGDIALILIVIIDVSVLHRGVAIPEGREWLVGSGFQMAVLILAIGVGIWMLSPYTPLPATQVMSKYHHAFVVPMFVYLLVTLLPVLWYGTTKFEWYLAWGLFGFWLVLLIIHIVTGRINQLEWLAKHPDYRWVF